VWDDGSYILLAYTKTLVKYNKYITQIMNLDARTDDLISTVDSYMYGLLRNSNKGFIDFNILAELCKKYNDESVFSSSKQLTCELEDFIYWNGITREEYVDESIERRGMSIPLNRKKREIVWLIKETIEKEMLNLKKLSKGFSRYLSREIRVSPFHSSKGLDMPVVLLFLPKLFATNAESYSDKTTEIMQRNLLYVCMTRAMDMLNVFMKEKPENQILIDLKNAFEESGEVKEEGILFF
jgi:superfamily I DNA/RNA helicase